MKNRKNFLVISLLVVIPGPTVSIFLTQIIPANKINIEKEVQKDLMQHYIDYSSGFKRRIAKNYEYAGSV